jgi:phosphoribosylformylglycinamidine synthase
VSVPDDMDPFVFLFSESQARAIVAALPSEESRFADLCAKRGVPCRRIGVVDGGSALVVDGLFSIALAELGAAHETTLPARFEN